MNTTKTAQFTPGPWREYHTHGNWEMYGSNGQLLFRIKDGVIPMLNDTALIAAAPAMYAELGKCISLIQALQARLNAHGEMCNFDDEEIASAKAALAQAEGVGNE